VKNPQNGDPGEVILPGGEVDEDAPGGPRAGNGSSAPADETAQQGLRGKRVASAWHGAGWPVAHTGEAIANTTAMRCAVQTVFHDDAKPSRVVLPLRRDPD